MEKYIFDKESRCILYANGGWKIAGNSYAGYKLDSQPDICSDNYYRKEKIIRNRALPKWIIAAIESGKGVLFEDAKVEGDYLKIRGKVVEPTTSIITEVHDNCCNLHDYDGELPAPKEDIETLSYDVKYTYEVVKFGEFIIKKTRLKRECFNTKYISQKKLWLWEEENGFKKDNYGIEVLRKWEEDVSFFTYPPQKSIPDWHNSDPESCVGKKCIVSIEGRKRYIEASEQLERTLYKPTKDGGEFACKKVITRHQCEDFAHHLDKTIENIIVSVEFDHTEVSEGRYVDPDSNRMYEYYHDEIPRYKITLDNGESFIW